MSSKCNVVLDFYYGDPKSILGIYNRTIDFVNSKGVRNNIEAQKYNAMYTIMFCESNDFDEAAKMVDEVLCRKEYLFLDIIDYICAGYGILASLILLKLYYKRKTPESNV